MRGRRIAIAVVLCASTVALADGLDAEIYRPATSSTGYFSQDGARTLAKHALELGLGFDFAHKALTANDSATKTNLTLVDSRLVSHLALGWGVLRGLELGFALPIVLTQSGDALAGQSLKASSLGDARLYAKFRLLGPADDNGGLHVSGAAALTLPSGNEKNYTGEVSSTVEARIIGEYATDRVTASLNGGLRLRKKDQLAKLTLGNELTVGAAAAYAVKPDKLWLLAEAYAALGIQETGKTGDRPSEALLGGRALAAKHWFLQLGAGFGLTRGYGAPDFRAVLSLQRSFASESGPVAVTGSGDGDVVGEPIPKPADGDPDQDGVLGLADKCPSEPGPLANGGCPVSQDGDRDGVIDANDKCPNEPEDKDGFQDADGCPDLDNDGDSVLDDFDKCKTEPEDKDGFQDADGCPELDNDVDGIPDSVDQCPNEPEVFNGVQDEDGCPDPGKALVTIAADKIVLGDAIKFDKGTANISKASMVVVTTLGKVMLLHAELKKIEIQGHTLDKGAHDKLQQLSEQRANAVRSFLVDTLGIEAERVTAVGYGPDKPLGPGKSKDNERIEITILQRE